MWVRCPQCGKRVHKNKVHHLPYFPFCSRRCKLVDLEGWLENRYKIPVPLNTERGKDDD